MKSVLKILFCIIFISSFAAQADEAKALATAKKIIKNAQVAWAIDKAFEGESLTQTKKGAYCALGEDLIDLSFVAKNLFGRTYTKAETQQQKDIESALLNNFAQIFLKEIADKINYTYDWENTLIETTNFGRGDQRSEGYSVKITTWRPEYDNLPPDAVKPTSYVQFEMISKTNSTDEFLIIDIVLAGIRVSELYKQWVNNIRMGRNTLEQVLETWATENQPLCPVDTEPYRKLFL